MDKPTYSFQEKSSADSMTFIHILIKCNSLKIGMLLQFDTTGYRVRGYKIKNTLA